MPIPERLIPAALARVDAGEATAAYERGRADGEAAERQRIVALLRKPFGPARADVAADWIERGMTAVDESETTHG